MVIKPLKQEDQAMAGTTTDMSKIKQVIRFHLDGCSNRAIAAALDMDKETVNRYVKRATADSMEFEALLSLDEPVLVHRLQSKAAIRLIRTNVLKRSRRFFRIWKRR